MWAPFSSSVFSVPQALVCATHHITGYKGNIYLCFLIFIFPSVVRAGCIPWDSFSRSSGSSLAFTFLLRRRNKANKKQNTDWYFSSICTHLAWVPLLSLLLCLFLLSGEWLTYIYIIYGILLLTKVQSDYSASIFTVDSFPWITDRLLPLWSLWDCQLHSAAMKQPHSESLKDWVHQCSQCIMITEVYECWNSWADFHETQESEPNWPYSQILLLSWDPWNAVPTKKVQEPLVSSWL